MPVIDLAESGLAAPDRRCWSHATDPHAAICGMTVVPAGGPFAAWAGQLLVSEMGDFRPTTDATNPTSAPASRSRRSIPRPAGATTFLRNRGAGPPQPASALDLENGFERPVDVRVGPDGLVYVLDFGVFDPTADGGEGLAQDRQDLPHRAGSSPPRTR